MHHIRKYIRTGNLFGIFYVGKRGYGDNGGPGDATTPFVEVRSAYVARKNLDRTNSPESISGENKACMEFVG